MNISKQNSNYVKNSIFIFKKSRNNIIFFKLALPHDAHMFFHMSFVMI